MSILEDENKSLRKKIEEMRAERKELQELVLEEIRIRTEIEGDLRRSEAEKAAILNAVPDTITLLNPELEYVWVNDAAARSLGKSPEEIVGRKCHDLWYNRDSKCDPCDIDPVLVSGQLYRNEYRDEHGIVWDILNVPILDENGEVESILRVSRDVTHRNRMRDEL
jgi:PAS domain S-box-containing protein